MKKLMLLLAVFSAASWSQTLDLSSLQKIATKAKETNEVNLDANQIRAALMFIPHDEKDNSDLDQGTKKLLDGLQRITIRNYEFEKQGEFQDADLEPIRSQLAKLKGWGKIVDSKEKDERSEVYMFTEDGKPTGIAVIDVEPRELSVVLVKGTSSLAEIGKLHGMMGLPNIRIGSQLKLPAKEPR
jgi:hypothetical protein